MAASVVEAAASKIDEIRQANPNYQIEVGGAVEGAEEGLASVVEMLPVMAIIILIVLMFQLQSVQRLLLVISVVPLGLIGVVLIMLITNTPVGFIAVLGMIALIGMITRAAVAAGVSHRRIDRARHAADHPRSFLVATGLYRHRWAGGRGGADADLFTGSLRSVVSYSGKGDVRGGRGPGCARAATGCCRRLRIGAHSPA
jgi:hypothetical protein